MPSNCRILYLNFKIFLLRCFALPQILNQLPVKRLVPLLSVFTVYKSRKQQIPEPSVEDKNNTKTEMRRTTLLE